MEVEENGCDTPDELETKPISKSEESVPCESIQDAKAAIIETTTQHEISKSEIDSKEAKNLKAKNDIEDDIRMICGNEETNSQSSQIKDEAVDNILETLQSDQTSEIEIQDVDHPKPNLKRAHPGSFLGHTKDNDDNDLFGFSGGKFVFGKKLKVNATEIDNKITRSNLKAAKIKSELIPVKNESIDKNKQNGEMNKENLQNIESSKLNATIVNNEHDNIKSSSLPTSPVLLSPVQTSNQSSAQKLRPSEDPIYRKPFEMGWKREIVLRALPGSKDKGEVYYITPNGKKLRTRHEIQINLTPGLTLENFTFSKDPLGAEPENEIIRSAKPTGRNTEISIPKTPEIITTSGKRIPKPKVPKGASPPPQGWTPTQAVKTQGTRSHSRYATPNTDDHHSKSTRGSSSTDNTNIKSSSTNKKDESCTIECVLAMGLIPQLQCVKCLSLSHHECVGMDRNELQSGNANETGNDGNRVFECESCKAQSLIKTDIPLLDSSIEKSNKLNLNTQLSENDSHGNILNSPGKPLINTFNNTSIKFSSDSKNTKIKDKDNSNAISPISVNSEQSISKNTSSDESIKHSTLSSSNIPTKSAQSIAVLNGRKYLVIHKPGLFPTHEHIDVSTTCYKSLPIKTHQVDPYVHNLFGNVSAAYEIMINVFKYLKVQELLRAACVSRLWNHVANERSLWKTVRMKNSQVNDWAGFASTLSRNSTEHLDLRKMICPKSGVDRMWTNFNENIQKVNTLKTIDLGRCPANVVQNLFLTSPQLNIINANSVKSETLNLENLNKLSKLTELRLKSVERCNLIGDLSSFAFLENLKHLSLTSIHDLGTKNIEILGQLSELESLELGECSSIQDSFANEVLSNLSQLRRLRLEKSTEISVTLSIIEQIAEMKNLEQLELVNFDIRDGFEQKIISCTNLKRFLLIPTYVSQSATTNQIILSSMRKLKTLESFTWVVTLELLSVTALYVDQCGSRDRRIFNDCIPVLKPVPGASNKDKEEIANKPTNSDIQQIEILPLSTIKEILDDGTPKTKHKIVRAAYSTTWRQTFVD